jgi:aromatic-L-amino-acid/L-tryptophan decarboxylase
MQDYHMSAEDFRRHGRAVVDWIADYLERVEELPVQSQVAPGDIRARLPAQPPEQPEPFERMLADIDEIVLPGVTHWQSPSFFAFFPANSSGPSILGELLSAGLGVQGMLWATSPACTEVETHVLDWLVDLLGLPERFRSDGVGGGVIQDSASSATLCALLAARERAGGGHGLVVYASVEAHSSVEKAVRIAGLGPDGLRLVETDDTHALRADVLEALIEQDIADGRRPCMVVATVGTTSSMAMDPVRAVAELCIRHGLWLHVDAAMAGTAALAPEHRGIHDGVELADSYCFNPHKWMFTNFDCDAFFVADRGPLIQALSVLPEYLRNAATEAGSVIDYRDWQIPLGRRFRALKLWFVIRHYGAEGLRHHVRHHIALAGELAARVEADERFELAVPAALNLVCLCHRDGDDATQRVLDAVNSGGRAYLTHTRLDGRLVLRVSVGQTRTERRHVAALWEQLQAAG